MGQPNDRPLQRPAGPLDPEELADVFFTDPRVSAARRRLALRLAVASAARQPNRSAFSLSLFECHVSRAVGVDGRLSVVIEPYPLGADVADEEEEVSYG